MAVPLPHLLRAATRAPPTDAELLDAFARRRDEGAFAELVRRHGPAVYRVCRRVVGPAAADDAFQAAFLVLSTRHRAARRASSIAGWLVGVAGRVARQIRRSEYRRARREAAVAWPPDVGGEPGPDVGDQLRVLDEELAGLPDRLRTPVVLCHLQGRSQEQAAEALGQSARTLRRRLEEARRLLRVRLERRGVVPALAAGLALDAGRAGAVPGGLAAKTVAMVFDYMTGGKALLAPPVVLANGVATTMLARNVAVLMVAAAVGLTALGVSFAGGQAPANRDPAADPFNQNIGLTDGGPAVQVAGQPLTLGGTKTLTAGWEHKFVATDGDRGPFERAVSENGAAGWEFGGSERVRDEKTGKTVLVLVFKRPAGGRGAAGAADSFVPGRSLGLPAPAPSTTVPGRPASDFNRANPGLSGEVVGRPPDRKTEVFKLSHGKADEVAKLLRDAFSGNDVVIATEPTSNSVLVAAPAATIAYIKRMLAAVDASAPAAGVKPTLIPLQRASARVVAEILGRVYTDRAQVRLTFDAAKNTLIVAGPEATVKEIKELVQKLDEERAEKP